MNSCTRPFGRPMRLALFVPVVALLMPPALHAQEDRREPYTGETEKTLARAFETLSISVEYRATPDAGGTADAVVAVRSDAPAATALTEIVFSTSARPSRDAPGVSIRPHGDGLWVGRGEVGALTEIRAVALRHRGAQLLVPIPHATGQRAGPVTDTVQVDGLPFVLTVTPSFPTVEIELARAKGD